MLKFLELGQIKNDLYDFTFLEYKITESTHQTIELTDQNKIYKSIENEDRLDIASNCDKMHPLMLIAMSGQTLLIKNPIVTKLIDLKFRIIPRIVMCMSLMLYMLFIIFFTINSERMISENLNNQTMNTISLGEELLNFYFSGSVFLLILIFIGEILKMINKGFNYFRSQKSFFDFLTYTLCFFALIIRDKSTKSSLYAFSLMHLYLIFVLNQMSRTPSIGKYSVAYRKTLKHFYQLFPIFFVLLLGFMFAFRLRSLYTNTATYLNESYGFSLIKLMTMVLGEFETYEMGLGNQVTWSNVVDYFNYYKFILLLSILLINLTVGVSIGEIKNVLDDSEIKNIKNRITFILKVQDMLMLITKYFFKLFPQKMQVNHNKWLENVLVFRKYDFSNENKFISFFKNIKNRLNENKFKIVSDNDINSNKRLTNNIEKILNKINHVDLVNDNLINIIQYKIYEESEA